MKIFFFTFLFFLIFVPIAFAHKVEEESPLLAAILPLLDFHDAVHWIVFIPFIGTCYYFRYVKGRFFGDPRYCAIKEPAKSYTGEGIINYFHRYFVWLMFFFVGLHLIDAALLSLGVLEYNFALFQPYIFPFTTSPKVPDENLQLYGEIFEWGYVLSLLVFLFSCYFFRFFVRGYKVCYGCTARGKIRGKFSIFEDKLNKHHGKFFWLGIIFSALLLLVGGHL